MQRPGKIEPQQQGSKRSERDTNPLSILIHTTRLKWCRKVGVTICPPFRLILHRTTPARLLPHPALFSLSCNPFLALFFRPFAECLSFDVVVVNNVGRKNGVRVRTKNKNRRLGRFSNPKKKKNFVFQLQKPKKKFLNFKNRVFRCTGVGFLNFKKRFFSTSFVPFAHQESWFCTVCVQEYIASLPLPASDMSQPHTRIRAARTHEHSRAHAGAQPRARRSTPARTHEPPCSCTNPRVRCVPSHSITLAEITRGWTAKPGSRP